MVAALRSNRKKPTATQIKKKAQSVKKVVKESLKRRTRSNSKNIELEDEARNPNSNDQSLAEFVNDTVNLDENGDEILNIITESTNTEDIEISTELENLQQPESTCDREAQVDQDEGVFQDEVAKICSHCGVKESISWKTGPSDFPCLCNTCSLNWKRGKILLAYKMDCTSPNLHTVFLQDSAPAVVPELLFSPYPSPNEELATANMDSYVSDFAAPLPKKFACPTVSPEKAEESYFYPSPTTLTDPEDRWEYLATKLAEVDSCQLAQMLLLLDTDTRNEFDRAIKIKKDASLDVSCLDDTTWSSLCGLFAQH